MINIKMFMWTKPRINKQRLLVLLGWWPSQDHACCTALNSPVWPSGPSQVPYCRFESPQAALSHLNSKLGAIFSLVSGDTWVHPSCRLIIFLNLSIASFTYWPQFSGQEIETRLSLGSRLQAGGRRQESAKALSPSYPAFGSLRRQGLGNCF